MDLILHFPNTSKEKRELSLTVSRLYASLFLEYLSSLDVEDSKKARLLSSFLLTLSKPS